MEIKTVHQTSHHSVKQTQMTKFLMESYLTDCTLHVGNQGIRCHRFVLAAASPAFLRLISEEGGIRAEYEIKFMSIRELQFIIWYIYTGSVDVGCENLPRFFSICRLFELSTDVNIKPKAEDEDGSRDLQIIEVDALASSLSVEESQLMSYSRFENKSFFTSSSLNLESGIANRRPLPAFRHESAISPIISEPDEQPIAAEPIASCVEPRRDPIKFLPGQQKLFASPRTTGTMALITPTKPNRKLKAEEGVEPLLRRGAKRALFPFLEPEISLPDNSLPEIVLPKPIKRRHRPL